MSMLTWLRGRISPKYRAAWLYRRGMLRAKAGRFQAAIDDYTEVIGMTEADPGVRAMARYNRALVRWSTAGEDEAIADLNKLLESPGAPEHVKTEARRKLLRIDRRAERGAARKETG